MDRARVEFTSGRMDWNGNSKSVFSTLGASSHSDGDRQIQDYYATPGYAVEALLELEDFQRNIWEPACGGGHIADVLKKHGHSVRCSDIVDRGFDGTELADFLQTTPHDFVTPCDIITNPPYSLATEFVWKAMHNVHDGAKVAMFLKIQFLETQKRFDLFSKYPPKKVWVFVNRVNCGKNGLFTGESSAVCYAWFVWQRGFDGNPEIDWITTRSKERRQRGL